MTPNQAKKKIMAKKLFSNLQNKREKYEPKFKLGLLARTADIQKLFSKEVSTNRSYKLYGSTEVIHVTTTSYKIN